MATAVGSAQAEAPAEVRGWNWGAFFLTWIWGIGNSVWIALLALIPGVSLIMMFVLGAKGNEWAWKAKSWSSVEDFRSTQRKWTIAGLIVFAIGVLLVILSMAAG